MRRALRNWFRSGWRRLRPACAHHPARPQPAWLTKISTCSRSEAYAKNLRQRRPGVWKGACEASDTREVARYGLDHAPPTSCSLSAVNTKVQAFETDLQKKAERALAATAVTGAPAFVRSVGRSGTYLRSAFRFLLPIALAVFERPDRPSKNRDLSMSLKSPGMSNFFRNALSWLSSVLRMDSGLALAPSLGPGRAFRHSSQAGKYRCAGGSPGSTRQPMATWSARLGFYSRHAAPVRHERHQCVRGAKMVTRASAATRRGDTCVPTRGSEALTVPFLCEPWSTVVNREPTNFEFDYSTTEGAEKHRCAQEQLAAASRICDCTGRRRDGSPCIKAR